MFKRIRTFAVIALLALVTAAPTAVFAKAAASEPVARAPTRDQALAAQRVYGLLSDSRYHYKPRPLDDALSSQIFDDYLKAMDNPKLFFTHADRTEERRVGNKYGRTGSIRWSPDPSKKNK